MGKTELFEVICKFRLFTADTTNCPWMKYAIHELGVSEANNMKRVSEFTKGLAKPTDEWCACFAHWCMKNAGVDTTRSGSLAAARSWMNWGKPLSNPCFGAVTVFRNPDPEKARKGYGHVAFYLGDLDDQIVLLGGNQGEAVCVASYKRENLLGYRWSPGLYDKVKDGVFDLTKKITTISLPAYMQKSKK